MARKSAQSQNLKILFLSLAVIAVGGIAVAVNINQTNNVSKAVDSGSVAGTEAGVYPTTIKGKISGVDPCVVNSQVGTILCYRIRNAQNKEYSYILATTGALNNKLTSDVNISITGIWVKRGTPNYMVVTGVTVPTPSAYPTGYTPPTPPP